MAEFNASPTREDVTMNTAPQDQRIESISVSSVKPTAPINSSVPFGFQESKTSNMASDGGQKTFPNPNMTVTELGAASSISRPQKTEAASSIARNPFQSSEGMRLRRERRESMQPRQSQEMQQVQPEQTESTMGGGFSKLMETSKKAYDTIKNRIRDGFPVTEEDKEKIIKRMSEISGVPFDSQRVSEIVDQRMNEQDRGTVEDISREQPNYQDALQQVRAMDSGQIISVMDSPRIPTELKQMITQTPEYQQAVAVEREKNNANQFNDTLTGKVKNEGIAKPTSKDILQSAGVEGVVTDDIKRDVDQIKKDDALSSLSSEVGEYDKEIAQLQGELNTLSDDITNEFGTSLAKSAFNAILYDRQTSINQKLQSVAAVRQAKADEYNRELQQRERELQRKVQSQQQNMQFLNANNGMALFGSTIDELQAMESSGRIPEGYASMYGNMMEGLIYNTLGQYGTVTGDDSLVIKQGIEQGYTPQEIMSVMMQNPKFQEQPGFSDKTVKVGNRVYQYNPTTGQYDVEVGAQFGEGYGISNFDANDKTYSIFTQGFNDYEGNRGADYPATRGTPIPAPADGVVTGVVVESGTGNIRLKTRLEDGRVMTVDHVDPSTLSRFGIPTDFVGRKELNVPFSAGGAIGFIGNTGNVATTENGKMVYIRKDGKLLRPDLERVGRGSHASVEMYDENGKMLSVDETDKLMKNYIAQSQKKDLSGYGALVSSYIEDGKDPGNRLEDVGISYDFFVKNAPNAYAKIKAPEYKNAGFVIENPSALGSASASVQKDLKDSIARTQALQKAMDDYIAMVQEHGTVARPGKVKNMMENLHNDIVVQSKEIYNLGVLNGPDLEILEKVIPLYTGQTGRLLSKNSKVKLLEDVQKRRQTSLNDKAALYGLKYDPESLEQDNNQEINQQFQQYMNDIYGQGTIMQ